MVSALPENVSQRKLHGEVRWGGEEEGHSTRLASANDVPSPRPGPTVFPLEAAAVHLELSQLDVAQNVGVYRGGGQGIICVSWGSR